MSIKVMSQVWENGPAKTTDRFVLLALADYANDEGQCWPSIAGIARKTCLTERGVQKCIRRLESEGWLEIEVGSGRKNCNVYTVKTPNEVHPERGSPPNMSAKRVNVSAENPEPGSPEPSLTINKPSSNNSAREVEQILSEWTTVEAARSFIAYRRKHKAKSLSVTAAKRLAKQLAEIYNRGGDTADALGLAEERGWQTVNADWYFKATEQNNGKRTGYMGRGSDTDAEARIIAFAARTVTAPRDDCF